MNSWILRVNRGAREGWTVGWCYIPYIRCIEYIDYQRSVTTYVHSHVEQCKEGASSVQLSHVNLETPYDHHWYIRRHAHFYAYLVTETRFRWNPSLSGVFAGWNDIESFSFATSVSSTNYPPLPMWWKGYEGNPFLFVSTPLASGGTRAVVTQP